MLSVLYIRVLRPRMQLATPVLFGGRADGTYKKIISHRNPIPGSAANLKPELERLLQVTDSPPTMIALHALYEFHTTLNCYWFLLATVSNVRCDNVWTGFVT